MAKKKANAITRLQKFLAAIAGDTTAPEPVTNEEKLLYNIAEKANEPTDDKFIVTLTPTSETEGEMDKSNVEIYEAAMSGKSIYFAINFNGIDCIVQATLSASFPSYQYPSFNAYGIDASGTTIINLYVDPSDEESYTFSMNAVEIGGESSSEIVRATVYTDNGRLEYNDSEGTLYEQRQNGKSIFVNGELADYEGVSFYANLLRIAANKLFVYNIVIPKDAETGSTVTVTTSEYTLTPAT